MSERTYPEEATAGFPEPPLRFQDGEGRTVYVYGYEPGAGVPKKLVAMYDEFDPRERAQGIPPTDEYEIRGWLTHVFGSGYNTLAWYDRTVVGHAMLVPARSSRDGPAEPHELAIFVLQRYQGAGIGTRLLRALLGHGASSGIERVWLTAAPENERAIGLYESVGFEVVDRTSRDVEMAIRLA